MTFWNKLLIMMTNFEGIFLEVDCLHFYIVKYKQNKLDPNLALPLYQLQVFRAHKVLHF